MLRIDAHIHYRGDHPDCVALLERLDMRLLNVCVAHGPGDAWRAQADAYRELAAAHPRSYAWCTTFDTPDFMPDYAERVIAGLERDFAAGAVACKFWKNIGMEIRKPSGEFLLIDDPLFDPIYAFLSRADKTALMHIGEPLACWQPLNEDSPHYGYYSQHPEWHMVNRPEYPSHRQLIDARDRVLARHPRLRVVGAHLGSLEYDVAEVAARLDRYPNLAVDTSARTHDLAWQDRDKVQAFLTAYQDRILFGTDVVISRSHAAPGLDQTGMSESERQASLQRLENAYQGEFAYYGSDQFLQVKQRQVQGLALPARVLDKLYAANAVAWYPGLD